MSSIGTIHICSLSKMKLVPSEKNTFFLTTRGQREIKGVRGLKELAPSQNLFNKYNRDWKGTDSSLWFDTYKEQYLRELPMSIIDQIVDRVNLGYDVTLMCYCGNEGACHRSILKEILIEKGCECISY